MGPVFSHHATMADQTVGTVCLYLKAHVLIKGLRNPAMLIGR